MGRKRESKGRVYWHGADEFPFVEQVQAISFVRIRILRRRNAIHRGRIADIMGERASRVFRTGCNKILLTYEQVER